MMKNVASKSNLALYPDLATLKSYNVIYVALAQASRVPRVRNILHMVEKFAEDGCSLIVGCAARRLAAAADGAALRRQRDRAAAPVLHSDTF